MIKNIGVAGLTLLLSTAPMPAQKRAPLQLIRFQGAPQYSQEELLAAGGFKQGGRPNAAELKARAKQLSDTGFFKEVKLSADSKGDRYTLVPSNQLFPMHLENLPLLPGKELDAALHQRFPLYRGQLPSSGSVDDGICKMFEEMLAGKGIKATVKAALTSGLGPQKITVINFSVISPAIHIGRIQLSGTSPAMEAKASLIASGQMGNNFDTENSVPGLRHAFEDLYHDQGYAAVKVDVSPASPFAITDQSVDIPYLVRINEGAIYKLGAIDLPLGMPVARADVEKLLSKYPPNSGRPLDLFTLAVRDAYHARGYLESSVVQHPAFNESTRVVNYSLEVVPGPQYRFTSVTFDGAPEAMASKLRSAWKMASADVFDESYLSTFLSQAQKKDKLLTKWMQTMVATYDFKADSETHQVNCVFHFAKALQPSH